LGDDRRLPSYFRAIRPYNVLAYISVLAYILPFK